METPPRQPSERATTPPRLRRLPADLRMAAGHGWRRLTRRSGGQDAVWSRQLGLLIAACFAGTGLAALFDGAFYAYVRDNRDGVAAMMSALTDIGLSQWYLIASGATLAGVLLADWRGRALAQRGRLALLFGQAAFCFVALLGSGLLVNVLKVFFGRSRPIRFNEVGPYSLDLWSFGYAYASFPSGHSTTMGAVAGILCLWFPGFWLPITLAALLLALTRVFAQAHYLSDVAAGFSLGLLFAVVLARLLASRNLVFRSAASGLLPAPKGLHRLRLRASGR